MKKKVVKCPQCGREFSYFESEFRPFCSEKCKMIDLGHWFSESYTIPVKNELGEQIEFIEDLEEEEDIY
ncbi:MAG: DNA gyrase inhibitor YacG [Halobacteriovoraceae bacterium]|nr:DNA gyrase inhibitor YacG [Halobacteriovoraceae bacterium]